MSYCKRIYKAGPVIDVLEYHTARYGAPGEKREEKRKATPEEMAKANQRAKERKAWHKILANFRDGDYFFTFTYRPEMKPVDMMQAKKDFTGFIRGIRKEYRKRGIELKWIRNIERGNKGAWHVHVIINAPEGVQEAAELRGWIENEWEERFGNADCRRLDRRKKPERGPFRRLAEYITKSGGIKPETGPVPKETNYSASRNLVIPHPETKHYLSYRTWRKIRVPKGYAPDPVIVDEGINPCTGFRYRNYVLVKEEYGRRLLYRAEQQGIAEDEAGDRICPGMPGIHSERGTGTGDRVFRDRRYVAHGRTDRDQGCVG